MLRAFGTTGPAWDGFALKRGPATVVCDGAVIVAVGFEGSVPPEAAEAEPVPLGDGLLTPGLVDAHTHLLFAGDRSFEKEMRAAGSTYLEILAAGGGIHHTVGATREADDETLLGLARSRLAAMLAAGTTTVEAKTGYGLAGDEELRHLRLYSRLADEGPIGVVPTLLMAHAVPPDAERDEYLDEVEETAVRAWEEGLAARFDVFLEEGAFSLQEAARLLWTARGLGFALTLHAGQFNDLGGASLAARVGARSLDHGEALAPGDPGLLAAAGVAVGLLPTCNRHLGTGLAPDARALLDAGAAVFLATDLNAGSSDATSLLEVAAVAAEDLGMRQLEILAALTSVPADALDRHLAGRLAPGAAADLAAWDGDESIFGTSPAARPTAVVVAGTPVQDPSPPL